MKNLKNKLFLATAIIALASCSENTYLGDQEGNANGSGAISFGSNTPALTRAERDGDDAAQDLGYSFAVYATKTVSSTTSNVFAQNTYNATSNTPYWVWYQASTANNTTSNSANWEYVGTGGSVITSAITAQTIKYWDEFASQYDFVAYKAKPVGTEPAAASITNLTTTGFTAQGTIEQLAALYIADKKVVSSGDYGEVVKFTFRKAASKVRLGIYETIPGYDVKDIKFNYNSTEDTDEAYLTGSFIYSSTAATFDVTYSGTPLKAVLTPASGTNYNANYFNFGSFNSSTKIGETSTAPTWTNTSSTNYYKDVLPNTSNVGAMTLTIDYTLINTVSGETINITGATATVPAAYMTWNPNFAYTYLFKITDDKLTPITFDAVTIDDGEGNQETITTVTEPSITTFGVKNGAYSVGKNEYETGTDIYATIAVSGEIQNPTSKYFVYTATTSDATKLITEASVADAIAEKAIKGVTPVITCTAYTTNVSVVASVPAEDGSTKTVTGAIKMQSPAAATYVVAYKQTAGSATATSDDYSASATYYRMTTTAEGFYTIATPTAEQITNWATEKANFTTAPTQPVYVYKVIKVVEP